MQIEIELIVIVTIILMLLVWSVWFRFTRWLAKKRYKPHNDKSKNGEEKRRANLERGERTTPDTSESLPRPPELTEQPILETTSPVPNGKNSKRLRGIFKRTRRK